MLSAFRICNTIIHFCVRKVVEEMADLLSVAVHLPTSLGDDIGSKSPRLVRSTSSENDTAAQTFGISSGKKVVDLEFVDLSYTVPGGLAKRE